MRMRRWVSIGLLGVAPFLSACEEEKPRGPARLSLQLTDMTHEVAEERHRYNHNRQFSEAAGVGVTLQRGKVCVMGGTECADTLVNYRIDPSATLVQPGHYIATPLEVDTVTFQYWGVDDSGNKVELYKEMRVDQGKWSELSN